MCSNSGRFGFVGVLQWINLTGENMKNENELTAALAQRLKAAAEKATQGNWRAFQYHDGRCGIGGGHNAEIMVCEHISKERPHDAMFIALANPANVLALVEALEKEQRYTEELREWMLVWRKSHASGSKEYPNYCKER